MTQTYQFVKVKAGEPFPWESGWYQCAASEVFAYTAQARMHFNKGEVSRIDWYILRPVRAPSLEEVEKEALELYSVEMAWVEYQQGFPEEEDINYSSRQGYIAGRMANNQ